MRLKNYHSFHDFRQLARKKLPAPIFNYIDGAADDGATRQRGQRIIMLTRLTALTGGNQERDLWTGFSIPFRLTFSGMLDPSMNRDDVAEIVKFWDGQFCLKGIMSVEDTVRAAKNWMHQNRSQITAGDNWTAHKARSINWRKSFMLLVTVLT